MIVSVRLVAGEHRLAGDWAGLEVANGFLDHLRARAFSPATVRAYAFDVANFARFLAEQHDDWIEGRRYLGLDALARSRTTLIDDQHTEEVKDPMTPAGLTA